MTPAFAGWLVIAIVASFRWLNLEAVMKLKVALALAITLLASLPSSGVAQITSATISGTITDETGGVLPGVDVVVRNLDTGVTRIAVTGANGYFTVPGLAPGTYEARATLQGFSTGVQTGLALEVAQQAALNITLRLGAASETITVTGESPLVDTRTSSLSAVVLEKTIEELPLNGRNYIMLATLQPGIVQFTEKSGTASATRGVQLRAAMQAADPWVGTWRVNVAKSRYAPGPAPKSTINVVAAVPNGIRTVNDTVTADGRTTHTEVTARFDGREYELTGAAVPTTRVYTRHGRGFVFVVRENGKETVSTTVVVSDDRRTITATSTGTDREGRRVNNVQVFERQ